MVASLAVPSTSSLMGAPGGVAGAFKKHLASVPMTTDGRKQGLEVSKATDIVVRWVSLRGGDIIFAGGYCREGQVEISEDDNAAIERLVALGFPFALQPSLYWSRIIILASRYLAP